MASTQIDRRKYPRVRTDAAMAITPVEDTCQLQDETQLAQAVDLGLGGIRFQCVGLSVEPGKIIEVTFTMGEQTATVVGKAVRVTRLDPFSQEVALAFVQVPPEVIECFYEAGLDGEA